MNRELVCRSSDGEQVAIDENSAKKSVLLKGIFDDFREPMDVTEMPEITGVILKKVFEFLVHYKDAETIKEIPRPLPSADLAEVCEKWDIDFINSLDLDSVFDLINAANLLDIKPLLDLSCAKVASEMKGKTADEIRQKFNIENDLTEEEMKEYEEFQI